MVFDKGILQLKLLMFKVTTGGVTVVTSSNHLANNKYQNKYNEHLREGNIQKKSLESG